MNMSEKQCPAYLPLKDYNNLVDKEKNRTKRLFLLLLLFFSLF